MAGRSKGGRYLRFVGFALGVVAALLVLGFQPTRRLAGDDGVLAMMAGCLISLAAALLAAWLLVTVDAQTPTSRMQTAFLAMIVRLAVVVVLGVLAVLGGSLARTPLLLWLAASYVVLLPLEVKLAVEAP